MLLSTELYKTREKYLQSSPLSRIVDRIYCIDIKNLMQFHKILRSCA